MDKDHFTYLIEIQSLNRQINDVSKENDQQKERKTLILQQIEEAKQNKLSLNEEKTQITKSIHIFERENDELTQLIDRTTKNLKETTTEKQMTSGEKELKNLRPRLVKNEESIIQSWENLELIESQIDDKEQFLIGVTDSLNIIKKEVDEITQQNNYKIEHLLERKHELIEMLPNECKDIYLSLESKYPLPITYLEDKQCGRCKGAIDHMLYTQINSLNSICLCPYCERIIISPEVQY